MIITGRLRQRAAEKSLPRDPRRVVECVVGWRRAAPPTVRRSTVPTARLENGRESTDRRLRYPAGAAFPLPGLGRTRKAGGAAARAGLDRAHLGSGGAAAGRPPPRGRARPAGPRRERQ